MTRLRIATFNVESLGEVSDAVAPLACRIAVLRPQFMRLDADILCLQEVDAEDLPARGGRALLALDELLAGTPYAGYFRAVSRSSYGDYPADRHNLVILSRFPIEASGQLRHDIVSPLRYTPITAMPKPSAAIEARFDRPFLHATVVLPDGRRLHVLNLHLKAPLAAAIPGQKRSALVWNSTQGWAEGFFLAAMKRAGQALEARLFVDRLLDSEPEALIAVCGDFNADSWEVPVRVLLGATEETNNRALASRALTALELQVSRPRRYSVIHAGRPVMLDHILASRALSALLSETELHNEDLSDEVFSRPEARRPAESFHAPLCAGFDLRAKTA
jgi:endonuclease/exonuclease/phosphatase family metal-dependent hydrolase